jgi:hypothetical protein
MSITTITSTDKIKLLDQMLEDLAGDEFDEYDAAETSIGSTKQSMQYSDVEELDMIDSMH